MKKVLIIEDEKHNQEVILWYLRFYDELQVVGICESIKDSLSIIPQKNPDLVLMDIELRDGTSFEILERLSHPHNNFKTIFITAYDSYSIKAIKAGAIDYILKPIDESEFRIAIDKFLIANRSFGQQQSIATHGKIVLRTQKELFFAKIQEVVFLKGESAYTTFYMLNQKNILVSKTLKEFENKFDPSIFVRIHRAYLVNVNHIVSYQREGFLTLVNDWKIPVSNRKKETILNLFKSDH